MDLDQPVPLYEIVAIGDGNAGKTCFVIRCNTGHYSDMLDPGIESDYRIRITDKAGCRAVLNVLDIAPSETPLHPNYFRNRDGYMLCFSVENLSTFENLPMWLDILAKYEDLAHTPMVLVGNKSDSLRREVSYDTALCFADAHKMAYFETSAKDNVGIIEPFHKIAQLVRTKKKTDAADADVKLYRSRPCAVM